MLFKYFKINLNNYTNIGIKINKKKIIIAAKNLCQYKLNGN